MQCNLDTRKIIFEKTENILPFEFKIPQDNPNKFKNHKIRLGWVANSLTKSRLGKHKNYSKPIGHFYVHIKTPSLHGNNSEFCAKTVNIKMSLVVISFIRYFPLSYSLAPPSGYR